MIATLIDNILVVKLGGGEGLDLDASCADLAAMAPGTPIPIEAKPFEIIQVFGRSA